MEEFEVYAIKYAELKARPAADLFMAADPHEAPVDMDYYIWLIRNDARAIVVDTGFSSEVAQKRGRHFLRCPAQTLTLLGVDPAQVEDVIITHLHYDHVGNFASFPAARFHMQEREVAFATGRFMGHDRLRAPYELEDVLETVRHVYQERIEFHDGDGEVAPGVTVHHSEGHSPGLQFVRVNTGAGWLVLASDACHYNRHRLRGDVFPVVVNVAMLLENYRRLAKLASAPQLVIPGHDPDVMKDYPPVSKDLEGVAVRLDLPF